MVQNQPLNDEEIKEKQKAHFERARKGVLKFLVDSGGALSLSEMHDYSLNKFLVQHQGFSQMMETFVGEGLVEYDSETQMTTITDEGRKFASQ